MKIYDEKMNEDKEKIDMLKEMVFKSLTNVVIPSSITSLDSFNNFRGNVYLSQISIPSSVTLIGHYAFFSCKSLSSVKIPSSVTYIGIGAFCDCISLTHIDIPPSVSIIGEKAFKNCFLLERATIPTSLSKDDVHRIGIYCTNITRIDNGNKEITIMKDTGCTIC